MLWAEIDAAIPIEKFNNIAASKIYNAEIKLNFLFFSQIKSSFAYLKDVILMTNHV